VPVKKLSHPNVISARCRLSCRCRGMAGGEEWGRMAGADCTVVHSLLALVALGK